MKNDIYDIINKDNSLLDDIYIYNYFNIYFNDKIKNEIYDNYLFDELNQNMLFLLNKKFKYSRELNMYIQIYKYSNFLTVMLLFNLLVNDTNQPDWLDKTDL